jgi:hypothetical protein
VAAVSILAAAGMVLVGLWRGQSLGAGGVLGLVSLGLALLLVVVLANLLALFLRDFAAPVQIAQGVSSAEAMRLVWALVRLYPAAFALYVLLKIVFAVILAMALMIAACFTCCCALLPVVTQTLFQPFFYFERAWSVCLLRPMGYDLMGAAGENSGAGAVQEPTW